MKGGWNAAYIIQDYKRKKAFEKKKRNKCILNDKIKCNICKYQAICESSDSKN